MGLNGISKEGRESGPVGLSLVYFNGVDNAAFVTSDDVIHNREPAISVISSSHAPTPNMTDASHGYYSNVNDSAFPASDHHDDNATPTAAKGSGLRDPPPGHDGGGGGGDATSGAKSPSSAGASVEMKRSINLLYCTAIMIAVTGHSSVFIAPAQIFQVSGSLGGALVTWLVGGIISLGTALVFAEMGTMFPKAGGPYSYAMQSFGPLVGFLMMWGYTILIAGPFWAFLAYTAALYIVRPIFMDCLSDDVNTAVRLLAGWIMVTMVVLNCVYMKYVTKVQTLLSGSKMIVLLIIIGSGIYNLASGNTDNFQDLFEGTTTNPSEFALGLFYSVFAYGGWQVMTTMLEEVKDPARDPPRSVYISFAVVITKYVLTNAAYGTLMSPATIIRSPAVALDFMDRMYSPLVAVVSALVALTSIGALNASIMGHSRLLFAGARNGHMPQILGMLHHKYLTPWPSIFVYTVWGLIMLFTGGVTDMIEFISLFSTIMTLVVIFSLLYLRWTKPDLPRPYKTWLFIPIAELIINAAILVLAIYQKPHKMGIGLAIFFAGIPVYWFGVLWKNKPVEFISIADNLTRSVQKILLVSKSKQS